MAQDETDMAAQLAERISNLAQSGIYDARRLAEGLLPVVRELGDLRESEGYWRGYRDGTRDAIALRGEAGR